MLDAFTTEFAGCFAVGFGGVSLLVVARLVIMSLRDGVNVITND